MEVLTSQMTHYNECATCILQIHHWQKEAVTTRTASITEPRNYRPVTTELGLAFRVNEK